MNNDCLFVFFFSFFVFVFVVVVVFLLTRYFARQVHANLGKINQSIQKKEKAKERKRKEKFLLLACETK